MQVIRFLVNWFMFFTASLWVPLLYLIGFFYKELGVQNEARGRKWLTKK